MRYFILVFVAFLSVLSVKAQPPKAPANPGDHFGEVTTAVGAVDLASLPALLKDEDTADVKVLAKVVDVCPKKGCWMQLQTADQSTVFVKFKDYGFFVPTEIIGKTVVVDAEAKAVTTSVEELRHYAEDAKKSKEEIAAINAPKKEIRLTATGVLVMK